MVVVNSDIYPVIPMGTEFADIVLPAAQWGEHEGARCNGERRLRYYAKLMDPPGEAKPDWWAVSRFAQKMGYEGFEWETQQRCLRRSRPLQPRRRARLQRAGLEGKARGQDRS